MTYDNGKIQVWLGITGWCYICITADGKKAGGTGYGSEAAALAAAMAR